MAAPSALDQLRTTRSGPLLVALATDHPDLADRVTALAQAVLLDLSAPQAPATATKGDDTAVIAAPVAPVLVAPPFATVRDVACLTPRGKHDVEFSESAIVLRSRSVAAGSADAALVISVSNVTGVFSLEIKDKYRKGPDGTTLFTVLSLRDPVLVGKTPHAAVAFAENGGKLAKAGPLAVPLLRQPDGGLLRDPSQLMPPPGGGADPAAAAASSSASAAATLPVLECSDQFAALRRLLAALCGRIGGSDPAVFRSAGGLDCIKAYSKTSDGFLFPLRRALLFGLRPLVAIPHSDIASVKVGRGGGSGASRTFDLDILTLAGRTVQFSMIDIEELEPLRAYVAGRTFGSRAAPPLPLPAAAEAAAVAAEPAAATAEDAAAGVAPSSALDTPAAAAAAAGAPPAPAASNMNEAESDAEGDAEEDGGEGDGDDSDDSGDSEDEEGEGDEDDEEEDEDDDGGAVSGVEDADMSDDELSALLEDAGGGGGAPAAVPPGRRLTRATLRRGPPEPGPVATAHDDRDGAAAAGGSSAGEKRRREGSDDTDSEH